MGTDFEVLAVGSTRELMFARKFAKDIIELSKTVEFPQEALNLIIQVEQSYRELHDDDLDRQEYTMYITESQKLRMFLILHDLSKTNLVAQELLTEIINQQDFPKTEDIFRKVVQPDIDPGILYKPNKMF